MNWTWAVIILLLCWNLWNEWNDYLFSKAFHSLNRRTSDNDRDICALANTVHRLEHPQKDTVATHTPKKTLTPKKPRRRTPPRR